MNVEIHILQNFASSNLNRDDTGSPKDCELGGVRRARISSQCLKRAMRDAFEQHALVPIEHRAARTKRLVEKTAERVASEKSISLERAERAVARALGGAGLQSDETKDWKTQYLLFLPTSAIDRLATLVGDHLSALDPDTEAAGEAQESSKEAKAKTKKNKKADAKDDVSAELRKEIVAILADGSRTPELGLFGRMIADAPDWNVEASCQVAHAVSTHRVSMEFDFYTAIDDLKKEDSAGSDMMGTIPFNSACFYRYLVVDTDELTKNLGTDDAAKAQAKETVAALVRAAVLAIPSGKQNSMAAHNLPSFVMVDVRENAESRSLANAFVDPVRPKPGSDLVAQSIERLANHAKALEKVYGGRGRKDRSFVLVEDDDKLGERVGGELSATNRGSLEALIARSVEAAFGSGA